MKRPEVQAGVIYATRSRGRINPVMPLTGPKDRRRWRYEGRRGEPAYALVPAGDGLRFAGCPVVIPSPVPSANAGKSGERVRAAMTRVTLAHFEAAGWPGFSVDGVWLQFALLVSFAALAGEWDAVHAAEALARAAREEREAAQERAYEASRARADGYQERLAALGIHHTARAVTRASVLFSVGGEDMARLLDLAEKGARHQNGSPRQQETTT